METFKRQLMQSLSDDNASVRFLSLAILVVYAFYDSSIILLLIMKIWSALSALYFLCSVSVCSDIWRNQFLLTLFSILFNSKLKQLILGPVTSQSLKLILTRVLLSCTYCFFFLLYFPHSFVISHVRHSTIAYLHLVLSFHY